MGETPLLELKDISKSYGSQRTLHGISLDVRAGEFLTFLGPSGCGKTTTLRIIGGFETPDSGSVHLKGADVTDLPPYKRDVHTVFQQYALFPHYDVFDNVAFGPRIQGKPESEIEGRVGEALALVKLSGFERRRTNQISGGQQQRVALARALVGRPSLLLLDEPLGALDLKLRKEMQLELKAIQRRLGITFIYVTHDQEEALTMSDRIAVFNRGRIEQLGLPRDIYEAPRTSFVADFIGAANILRARLSKLQEDQALVQIEDEIEVMVPRPGGLEAKEGDQVAVAIRPERIVVEFAEQAKVPGPFHFPAVISSVVYLGSSTQLYLSPFPKSGKTVLAVTMSHVEPHLKDGGADQRVWLQVRPADILLLASPAQP